MCYIHKNLDSTVGKLLSVCNRYVSDVDSDILEKKQVPGLTLVQLLQIVNMKNSTAQLSLEITVFRTET